MRRSAATGTHASGRDIVWRVRPPKRPMQWSQIISDPKLKLEETNRYFRSLEYHAPGGENRGDEATVVSLDHSQHATTRFPSIPATPRQYNDDASIDRLFADCFQLPAPHLRMTIHCARNDAIIVRAIERMPGYDYSADEHVKAAIDRHLARNEGTAEYLKLAKRFRPDGMADKLTQMLVGDVSDSVKVEAAGMLGETESGPHQLRQLLKSESVADAAGVAMILGLLGNGRGNENAERGRR